MIIGIVPAGGNGRRLGGVDKASIEVGGRTLLDRVLGGLAPVCEITIVVGPARPVTAAARFVLEAELGGGPVPAIAAGLAAARNAPNDDIAVVAAVDFPFLEEGDVRHLVDTVHGGASGAAAAGPKGANPLLAAYRVGALRAAIDALASSLAGQRADRLLPPDVVVVDLGERATLNVNRPEDLARARAIAGP